MQLRAWVNSHPVISSSIVIGALLVALGIIYAINRTPAASGTFYFYDTGSGRVFAAAPGAGDAPAPSGKEAVRAIVLGCGGCPSSPTKGDVAYLQKSGTAPVAPAEEMEG